ncbi:hypothetical protein H312_02416 [Anncaliia algerae PRA339]|uniref:Uncharacterized protein n=1 Tax=Anncaliia algerae PRA339 TaxID=1288291 RepID=A0A059EZ48_9MICR|nr:hypothetical protein H312_02416 [Anncaliia algerae PRA339]
MGSTIYTDKWKNYIRLESVGYVHFDVNHQAYFIDPVTGENTQLIESSWSCLKNYLKLEVLVSNAVFLNIFRIFTKKYGEHVFIKSWKSYILYK